MYINVNSDFRFSVHFFESFRILLPKSMPPKDKVEILSTIYEFVNCVSL